ncbi:hypothetical protein [Pseudactinotalea sp. Z1748]|uniref:hypothetical protein n=1 Tax=Pseudactinotalea sp. Z1748 TaxID=3413027 RepID=UPI003C7B1139
MPDLHTIDHHPTPAARDLMTTSETEIHAPPTGDGLVVLAHAQGLIEEALR